MENLNSKPGAIKVGIVDDHISVTCALANFLNDMEGIQCTLEAYDGKELLSILADTIDLPDIILMDIDMPGMGGVEATRQLTELYPSIKIIAFTQFDDEMITTQMVTAGACGYLLKRIRPSILEEVINKVYEHEKYHANQFYICGDGLAKVKVESARLVVKPKEIQFLKLHCLGLTFAEIAIEMKIEESTVRYYKNSLAEKLGESNLTLMVIEALRLGLISIPIKL
jgi:DNA-binding NarL/FixJ family response regulator